ALPRRAPHLATARYLLWHRRRHRHACAAALAASAPPGTLGRAASLVGALSCSGARRPRRPSMQGILTTAVIDAARGAPAKAMLVDLFRLPGSGGERRHLKTIETNGQGGVAAPLLAGEEFQ